MAYRHYITVDENSNIIDGFSTGEQPGRGPGEHDALLTDAGAEAFALLGTEHPALKTADGIPLYKWEDGAAVERTAAEIEADRPEETETEPTELEQLRADVDFLLAMEDLL